MATNDTFPNRVLPFRFDGRRITVPDLLEATSRVLSILKDVDARIDDGALDVCVCDGLSRGRMLALLPRTLRGTHVGAACVHMRRARRVRVTSESPLPVHADGEVLYEDAHALDIEIVPARLRLLG